MTLTERMTEAARLSGITEAEAAWDRAAASVRAGTLDRASFDAVHAGLLAAQDRYIDLMRVLRGR